MSDMIKILFYSRKSRVNSDGRVPINMRITLNGQRFEVATSRYVLPNEWSDEAMTTTRKSRDSKEIDEFLQTLRAKALSIQKKLLMVDKKLTIEEFSNQWHGRKEKPKMLLEIFRQHNEQVKALIGTQYSHATWKRYNTSHDHTLHFLQQKYGVSDISVDKIKYEFITDYEFWLKSIRKCNHNSTIKYLTNFKKIVHICLNNGWIDKNPFVGFKMANKEVERPFLTEEELQTIASKEFLMPRIDQVRDLFLFCCYTGLAYVDICKLKRSEIANGVDGEKWIFTNRQKTESASRIPLLPPALKIIDKYKDHPECKIKDCLFPVPSNQKMNLYLKEIADACGISKNFTTHTARHTFATTITLTNGVPIETVSKMLGHRNLKTTQHYAKILDKKVGEDMNLLRLKYKDVKKDE
ncbi:MAG: recombinase [Flavobacterium psychrophilum]|jgi:site-specific recombinase XerD|nr:MAG: recombinase [Flavobacterium psychrophilum]